MVHFANYVFKMQFSYNQSFLISYATVFEYCIDKFKFFRVLFTFKAKFFRENYPPPPLFFNKSKTKLF